MPEICDGQMDIQCNVLKKLAEEDFSNLSFLKVHPTPFWEKLAGEDFSKLPLFGAFSPENLKKG